MICCSSVTFYCIRKGFIFSNIYKIHTFDSGQKVGEFFSCFFKLFVIKTSAFGIRYFKYMVISCSIQPGKYQKCIFYNCQIFIWWIRSLKLEIQLCFLSSSKTIYVLGHKARAGCFPTWLSLGCTLPAVQSCFTSKNLQSDAAEVEHSCAPWFPDRKVRDDNWNPNSHRLYQLSKVLGSWESVCMVPRSISHKEKSQKVN